MLSKFILDENIPRSVYRYLRSKGCKVEYVPRSISDIQVIRLAVRDKAILITRDSDFANPLLYPPEKLYGIIVLKIHPPIPIEIIKALETVLDIIKDFRGKTVVVYKDKIEVIE